MFAQIIKQLRKEKRMSQSDLARQFHIAQQTVGKWESGITCPSPDTMNKLADFFNVSIDYLMGREKPAETIRRMLGAGKPDPKKELLYALIGKIPNEKVPMAQSLLNVLLQDDYNNMA